MRLFSLFFKMTFVCLVIFCTKGLAQTSCDRIFSSPSSDLKQIHVLPKMTINEFIPDREISYYLIDFSQLGSSSAALDQTKWFSEKLHSFFQSIPPQEDYRQVIALTAHVTESIFSDFIRKQKNGNSQIQVKSFGLRQSYLLWKEVLSFWLDQHLTEQQMDEGKIVLLHLLQKKFQAHLPLDHFFTKFFMADNLNQMEIYPTTLVKKIDADLFKFTTLNNQKLSMRRYLLNVISMVPVGSRPQYFHKEEIEAISYMTNEIVSLAPTLPLFLLESVLLSYIEELEFAVQRRVRPFLQDYSLRSGMNGFYKNCVLLGKISDQFLREKHPDLGTRFQSLIIDLRQNLKDAASTRNNEVQELLSYYNEDPKDFLNERLNIFKAFNIDVILHLIMKLDFTSERQEWADEYYLYIRNSRDFIKSPYYQKTIDQLRQPLDRKNFGNKTKE